ncbi:MAG: T9SS type A sorting domain-containing protein, partial [Bacteroidia bacterium]|nr:T9SS type A sorting domain-containing protein [Bacteroidia bacterium]
YLTHAVCQPMRGGIDDGHAIAHLQQTSCPLFRGDSASGYSSDSLYLTHAVCQPMRGGIDDGHAIAHLQQTSCPLYHGSQASGYAMAWSTCTPLAQAELVLSASWLHPQAVEVTWLYLSDEWGFVDFLVERSENGLDWVPIGEKSAQFPRAEPVSYVDEQLPEGSRWAYRVRLPYRSVLSNIAWVERKAYRSFQAYPNPLSPSQPLVLQLHPAPSLPWRVVVFDLYGRALLAESVPEGKGTHFLFLTSLAAGLYVVQIEAEGQIFSTKVLLMP